MELMVDTWINIEDGQDIIDTILDDELVALDVMENSGHDLSYEFIEDDSEGKEEVSTKSPERECAHLEAVEAMDLLQSYIISNNMPSDNRMVLDKLR